jgi:uncharacterized protein (TIGR03435 family)
VKLFLLVVTASTLWAQPLAFEVASVKPNTSGKTSMMSGPNTVLMENNSLRRLIQIAYRLQGYDYSGPAWLDNTYFDVTAKFPAGVTFKQMPEMLQTLLAERFKLAIHREEKEVSGLLLVLDKKGLRIQPVEPGQGGASWGPTLLRAKSTSMADIAVLLASSLQSPVKDQTGAPGVYDINLTWPPDGSVYEALQEIGLKLQVTKLPVQVLVVDHAERVPTEN